MSSLRIVPGRKPRFTETELRAAIGRSKSWTQVLRELGYCPSGGNPATVEKYALRWEISVEHFDPYAGVMERIRRPAKPLSEILVEGSTFSRSNLKQRLYREGVKEPICELCGQGEIWRDRHMSLILDHINGVRNDNRIENLRIVCPNCAATLDTHCGRAISPPPPLRHCERCGTMFRATHPTQRYCSRACGVRWDRSVARGRPKLSLRKVERPPYEQLMEELEATSYVAVGRRYGVSDNAVRKWVGFYEREREARPR